MFMRGLCLVRSTRRCGGAWRTLPWRALNNRLPGDSSMTMSMYSASVPVFQHMLKNLVHILDKGEQHAAARKFDPSALTTYRLAPDMLPFTRQILIACD